MYTHHRREGEGNDEAMHRNSICSSGRRRWFGRCGVRVFKPRRSCGDAGCHTGSSPAASYPRSFGEAISVVYPRQEEVSVFRRGLGGRGDRRTCCPKGARRVDKPLGSVSRQLGRRRWTVARAKLGQTYHVPASVRGGKSAPLGLPWEVHSCRPYLFPR